jgi:hypothetical protein
VINVQLIISILLIACDLELCTVMHGPCD